MKFKTAQRKKLTIGHQGSKGPFLDASFVLKTVHFIANLVGHSQNQTVIWDRAKYEGQFKNNSKSAALYRNTS